VLDDIYIISSEGFEYINPAFEKITGYTSKEVCSREFNFFNLIHPDGRKLIADRKTAREETKQLPSLYEFRLISKDRSVKHVEVNSVPLSSKKGRVLGILRDITGRRRAEKAFKESDERYRSLVERANEGIAIIQEGLIKYVNPFLEEMSGYRAEELIDTPFSRYIATDELSKIVDIYRRRMAREQIVQTCESIVKRKDGQRIFVEFSGGIITHQGKPADLVIIRDITKRKKSEDELNRTLEMLRKAMGATIQALNLTVEMRDPYTAGHQRRVADLARSIAKEMGISQEKIDAIRMAASIHDIGKIAIPSEILSKPGRINENEFSLIKTHPQVGYDILKTIEFPWPVAQIVRQHHERMDGSGYPQGLSGKDILIEARIISVADVIEAMNSHRPYRTALRIEEALEEISQKRGVLYDPDVVDACVRLFKRERFKFKLEMKAMN
jgi:PAS domain S-box-containing protein/putative nucleotidyltransferase with HDIG domain